MAEETPTISILDGTKEALDMDPDYTEFDQTIIMHINSVLADLHLLGVGPSAGFAITGSSATWPQFLGGDDPTLNNIKTYLYLRVKVLFDPSQLAHVATAIQEQIVKYEYLINIWREEGLIP